MIDEVQKVYIQFSLHHACGLAQSKVAACGFKTKMQEQCNNNTSFKTCLYCQWHV